MKGGGCAIGNKTRTAPPPTSPLSAVPQWEYGTDTHWSTQINVGPRLPQSPKLVLNPTPVRISANQPIGSILVTQSFMISENNFAPASRSNPLTRLPFWKQGSPQVSGTTSNFEKGIPKQGQWGSYEEQRPHLPRSKGARKTPSPSFYLNWAPLGRGSVEVSVGGVLQTGTPILAFLLRG